MPEKKSARRTPAEGKSTKAKSQPDVHEEEAPSGDAPEQGLPLCPPPKRWANGAELLLEHARLTPVDDSPARARAKANGLKGWRLLFIESLAITCNVALSARAAGVSKQAAYKAREKEKVFAKEWDAALLEGNEMLEAAARQRAMVGTLKAVYHEGFIVGYDVQYSDRLMEVLLKAHMPEKYRETVEHRGNITATHMTLDEFERRYEEAKTGKAK